MVRQPHTVRQLHGAAISGETDTCGLTASYGELNSYDEAASTTIPTMEFGKDTVLYIVVHSLGSEEYVTNQS